MHDALAHHACTFDTSDVDDTTPYVPRTRTDDLEMMVYLDDGRAHRPMTRFLAACGEEIRPGTVACPTVYAGEMCQRGCWTKRELLEAQATNDVDAEDRQTGEFERIDLNAASSRMDLVGLMDRQRRRTDRIEARRLELEQKEKEVP